MKRKFQTLTRILISCLLVLMGQNVQSQVLDWVRTTGSIYKQGTMIARDADDNVISCGYTVTDRTYTRKWDKFGNFIWETESVSGVQSNYEQPSWITVDGSDNVVVLGFRYTFSSGSIFPNALVVLKYAPDGTLLFKTTIPGVYGQLNKCAVDADQNILIGASGIVTGQPQAGFILIKLDANGNTVFVSTHNFGNVHGVYGMRYRNGRIALTGTTTYNNFNCTTALFDDNGNFLWGATTTSLAGQDVELDESGNVYTINTDYFSGLDQDIKVTKYNVNGSVLFTYFYDKNSNYESASRINLQPDGNLVVSGITSTPVTGVVTFKLTSGGILMWDKFLPTNAIPAVNFLATDIDGDVFITGSSSITGGPAGVLAVKYEPDGNQAWSTAYDSTASAGNGIAIATDGSIYIVAKNTWTVLHYLDISPGSGCTVPAGVTVSAIGMYGATVSWNSVAGAIVYHVQYKTTTCDQYTQVSTGTNSLSLNNLLKGTVYSVKAEAACSNGVSGFSSAVQFKTKGKGYCASTSLDASSEFIDLVWIGSILDALNNSSGYIDRTNLSTDLVAGSANNSIWLSASLGSSPVYFRVWIDFNRDGDFKDAGEKVVNFNTSSIGWTNKFFNVPANASTGGTKMRVSMRYGGYANSCMTFDRGQVADYYINLLPARDAQAAPGSLVAGYGVEDNPVNIYPNPATSGLNISWHEQSSEKADCFILDLQGRIMIRESISGFIATIDVSKLTPGIYFLVLRNQDGHSWQEKFIKE